MGRELLLWGVTIFFLFLGNMTFIAMHEQIHQQILSYYGIKSKIRLGFLEGETIPTEIPSGLTEQEIRDLRLLNSLHEIYSMQTFILYVLIVASLPVFLLLVTETRRLMG